MAVIRFNCVVNGKRTSTSLSEHLVRHYAAAVGFFDNVAMPTYDIDTNGRGYMVGAGSAKKKVQDFINGLSNLQSTDEIEYKMLQKILYTSPKRK